MRPIFVVTVINIRICHAEAADEVECVVPLPSEFGRRERRLMLVLSWLVGAGDPVVV